MAQKRMFSMAVVDTDRFLDMPVSAQALYFHLGLHGDDDGFVSSPKKIARSVGCNDDDLRLLAAKGYIIPFDSGVVVITDWKVNNTLKNDRYHATIYQTEIQSLMTDDSGRYVLGNNLEPSRNQIGSIPEPEHNRTEYNETKSSGDRADKPPTRSKFSPPTVEEVRAYCVEAGLSIDAGRFVDFYESKGWKVGSAKMSSWKAAARNWARRDRSDAGSKVEQSPEQTFKNIVYC